MAKKQAKGRPTNATPRKKGEQFRTPIWMEAFLVALKNSNCVGIAAKVAGVDKTTAYRRREADPVFAERWMEAKEMSIEEVETTLRERALKGTQKPVWYRGVIVGYETVYDHLLLLAWLNANCPEKYRPNYDLARGLNALANGKTA